MIHALLIHTNCILFNGDSMDKLDDFKRFIKDKHFLANKVKDGTYTWQTLYETYDMFGPDHEFFKEDKKNDNISSSNDNNSINKIFTQIKQVDTKKISDGLENVKKIVGLIDEFRPNVTSSSKLAASRIKPFRKYND